MYALLSLLYCLYTETEHVLRQFQSRFPTHIYTLYTLTRVHAQTRAVNKKYFNYDNEIEIRNTVLLKNTICSHLYFRRGIGVKEEIITST